MNGMMVDDLRGKLVITGLGHPFARTFVAATVVGVAAYATGFPRASFTDDGGLKPFKPLSRDPEATYAHFLVLPIAIGTAAFLFT